jgi:hypothetical protein
MTRWGGFRNDEGGRGFPSIRSESTLISWRWRMNKRSISSTLPSLISDASRRMERSPLPAFGHPLARQAGEENPSGEFVIARNVATRQSMHRFNLPRAGAAYKIVRIVLSRS